MFSESPRRKSRTSRIIHELLDTPPDGDVVEARHNVASEISEQTKCPKDPKVSRTLSPRIFKKKRVEEVARDDKHRGTCQDLCSRQVSKPLQSVLSKPKLPNSRGRAIWFLQTPMNDAEMDGATHISRLDREEEAAMNAALETVPSSA